MHLLYVYDSDETSFAEPKLGVKRQYSMTGSFTFRKAVPEKQQAQSNFVFAVTHEHWTRTTTENTSEEGEQKKHGITGSARTGERVRWSGELFTPGKSVLLQN